MSQHVSGWKIPWHAAPTPVLQHSPILVEFRRSTDAGPVGVPLIVSLTPVGILQSGLRYGQLRQVLRRRSLKLYISCLVIATPQPCSKDSLASHLPLAFTEQAGIIVPICFIA
jgi:hypothetical protein